MGNHSGHIRTHTQARGQLRAAIGRSGWAWEADDVSSHSSARAKEGSRHLRRPATSLSIKGIALACLSPIVFANALSRGTLVFLATLVAYYDFGIAHSHAKSAFLTSVEAWQSAIESGHLIKAILAFGSSFVAPVVLGDLAGFWDVLQPLGDMLDWLIGIANSDILPTLWDLGQEPNVYIEIPRDPLNFDAATQ